MAQATWASIIGYPRSPDPRPLTSRMVDIISHPIDTDSLLRQVGSPAAGAVVLFVGTTREFTAGRQTASLEY